MIFESNFKYAWINFEIKIGFFFTKFNKKTLVLFQNKEMCMFIIKKLKRIAPKYNSIN